MKKLLSSLILIALFSLAQGTGAQTMTNQGYGYFDSLNSQCGNLNLDFHLGSSDNGLNTQVSTLQDFLISRSFLMMPSGVAKGYFGNLTRAALASFQRSVNISPAIGYFGSITRGYVNSHCAPTNSSAPQIYSISPSSGPIGSEVILVGSFSALDQIKFGATYISHPVFYDASYNDICRPRLTPVCPAIPSKAPIFRFIVPSIWPCGVGTSDAACSTELVASGIYPISVTNSNGISNSVNFTVNQSASTSLVTKHVGETEGIWKIQRIGPNQNSLEVLEYTNGGVNGDPFPNTRVLRVGDQIMKCVSYDHRKLTKVYEINVSTQTASFSESTYQDSGCED